MKVLFAVYHDCNKEERSMEILECCKYLGEVCLVSYATPKNCEGVKCYLINKSSQIALLHFIKKIKEVAQKEEPDIIVLHDSDCAITIPYLKRNFPNAKIVYDSSEFDMPMKGQKTTNRNNGVLIKIKSKLTRFREKSEIKYLKYADLVIATNTERANLMIDYFHLREKPIVFDNMHKINGNYNRTDCQEKFDKYISKDKFKILFAGGIDEERLTFDYLKSFLKLDDSFQLIVVGSASQVALKRFNSIVEEAQALDRVTYLGFISRLELKYLIRQCQASVVVFDKKSYNTLYCASGKMYESLFEGIPILTSENPPLARLCQQHGVGVSNDDYSEGISTLRNNYEQYKLSVKRYIDGLNYDERIENLANTIREKLEC